MPVNSSVAWRDKLEQSYASTLQPRVHPATAGSKTRPPQVDNVAHFIGRQAQQQSNGVGNFDRASMLLY